MADNLIEDLKPVAEPVLPAKDSDKDLKPAEPVVPLEESKKDLGKDVEEMLLDGTPKDKAVSIQKDKFDDINEKSKLFEKLEPLIAKLSQNPNVVENLLNLKDPNEDLATKVARLESDIAARKQKEVKETLTAALQQWPELKSRWMEVRPLVEGLEKQGYSYAESLERAWFAVNPEAAKKDQRIFVQEANRNVGIFSSNFGGGKPPVPRGEDRKAQAYAFNEADEEFIRLMGWGEKEKELYQKHAPRISKFGEL